MNTENIENYDYALIENLYSDVVQGPEVLIAAKCRSGYSYSGGMCCQVLADDFIGPPHCYAP